MTIPTEITAETFTASLRTDGVVVIAWNPGVSIGIELARAANEAGRTVAAGEVRGLLVDMRTSGPMDKQARTFFTTPHEWVYAVALWVASPLSVVIANFFLAVNRTPRPTKMFTNQADAVAWLIAQRL